MVSISEFAETVQEYLLAKYPEIEKTYCKAVHKNNNVILHGIAVKDHSSNVSPMIYIDDFYQQVTEGEPLDMICDQISSIFEAGRLPQMDMNWFTDIKMVKEMLSVKLINQKDNQEFLKDVPHFEYGDLAGIYQVKMNDAFIGANATITLKNEHLTLWNISPEQLHQYTMQNLESTEFKIQSMIEIFREDFPELPIDTPAVPEPAIYVLSNKERHNGAAGILKSDLLQSFSKQIGSNLIVLPSSIHEMILVPDHGCSLREMAEMVTEINKNEVSAEERLSNNAYFYDRKEQTLYQGTEKRPMRIQVSNADQKNKQTSILGKLKSHQNNIQEPEKELQVKEHNQRQTER